MIAELDAKRRYNCADIYVFPCPFLTDTPLLVTEDETSS
jgi:hypothetical protein